MNTTLIFAELLVIGIQVSVCVVILVLVIFGLDPIQSLQNIDVNGWELAIITAFLPIVYSIGVVFDRFSDQIFDQLDKKIRYGIIGKNQPLLDNIKFIVFDLGKKNSYLASQFEYTRSRFRVARSSTICFGVATILLAVLIGLQATFSVQSDRWVSLIFSLIIGGIFTWGAYSAWSKLTRTYYEILLANYEQSEWFSPDKHITGKPKGQ